MQPEVLLPETDRPRRQALIVILATFLASRTLLILIAALVEFSLPTANLRSTFSATPILASFTGSDSVFLLGIASGGYHAEPIHDLYLDWAFFPLFPIVTRLASLVVTGNIALAGVLVSNAAALGAAWLMYRLGEPKFGHTTALLAVVYLLIAPGAVAFGMAYTDSLFLLLALCAFLAARERRWWLMSLAYGLAAITRLPGILLGVPLLVIVWQTRDRNIRSLLPLVSGPIALAGFTIYLWLKFGVWLAYLRAQVAWTDQTKTVVGGGLPSGAEPLVAILIAILLVYVFLLVYVRRDRMDVPSIAVMVVAILTVLVSGRLLSVGRYLAVAWPFSWVLASRTRWVQILVAAASGAVFSLLAILNFTQALAP
ncbi:MAG: glycosyltransferase family 39 protein [Chloroflexi bacterium]|nr:glycosyltransferase family 39 protein [Chloroflexota bacterium]